MLRHTLLFSLLLTAAVPLQAQQTNTGGGATNVVSNSVASLANKTIGTALGVITPAGESPFDDIKPNLTNVEVSDLPTNSPRSVNYDDTPFLPAMRQLANWAGINYIEPILHNGDEPPLNIHLANIAPLEAFKTIAESRGFEVIVRDGIYTLNRPDVIGEQAMVIKKYKLKYLDSMWTIQEIANLLGVTLEKPSKVLQSYPEPTDQFSGAGGGGGGGGGSSGTAGGGGIGGSQGSGGSSGSSGSVGSGDTVATLPSEPRWTTTLPFDAPLSKGGFDKDQNGQDTVMFVDRRDNSIVVRATQAEHRIVAQFIEENDRPEAEVLIEVKLVEITADAGLDQGLDWSQMLGPAGGLTINVQGAALAAGGGAGGAALATYNNGQFSFAPSGFIISGTNATVTIRDFMSKNKGQALSVPSVITKSGVPVTIRSGVQNPVPIQTLVTGASTSGNQSFTSGYNIFTTGLTMDTLATILDNGYIDLNINPAVSRQIGSKTIPGAGEIPIISTRQASTTVTVKSGETVVIGGLYEFTSTASTGGIPPFDKIPFLGKTLFGNVSNQKTRTNLLIFVTPHIVINGYQVDAKLTSKDAAMIDEGEKEAPVMKVTRKKEEAKSSRVELIPSK